MGRRKDRLPGVHPVDVAANGVDFSVVAKIAEGVRQLPGRKSIGGKTLVHHAEGAGRVGVEQFVVELADLGGKQQALVDNGARRKGGDEESLAVADIAVPHGGFDPLADDKQFTLESVGRQVTGAAYKELFDVGLGSTGNPSEDVIVHRHVAPAENG